MEAILRSLSNLQVPLRYYEYYSLSKGIFAIGAMNCSIVIFNESDLWIALSNSLHQNLRPRVRVKSLQAPKIQSHLVYYSLRHCSTPLMSTGLLITILTSAISLFVCVTALRPSVTETKRKARKFSIQCIGENLQLKREEEKEARKDRGLE